MKNWSVLVTVYQLLAQFLREMEEAYLLPAWQDCIVETVQNLRQELASQVFLDILGQLLAGGQAVIDDDMRNPREHPPGVTVIGYRDENYVYLLPEIAHKAVNHVQPIHFGTHAIGLMLNEEGWLIPGKTNLSVQKSVRGNRVRFWQLKAESLLETVETVFSTRLQKNRTRPKLGLQVCESVLKWLRHSCFFEWPIHGIIAS